MLNILFCIAGLVILVWCIIIKVMEKMHNEIYSEKQVKKNIIPLIYISIILFIMSSSFTIIKTGYTGVKSTFGQINSNVLVSGFNFKIPFIQSIEVVNNKQQDITFNGDIWGEASDKTVVFATDVVVTYQINPEKSTYIYSNVTDYKHNLITQTLVNSAIKSAMVQLPSDKVTNRNNIEPLAKETLENAIIEKYGSNTVIILKVTINNMDFEESYNKAIAEKQIARQEAEKQSIENQKVIDIAKANQEKATIEAETKKIEAQGNAEAEIITAKADAEAYKIKSAEITENLLKKWELDARSKHGWVTIQGANTIVTSE